MKYRVLLGLAGWMLSAHGAHGMDLDLSGFGSFIGGYSNEGTDYLQYTRDDLDYQPDTLAGLQVSGRINEKASATVQIIASALDDWNTSADWAYVTYQPRSDFTWKAGRFRAPFFLYSENITVGYTYPWITPPYSVYHIPFTSVDGVSLSYSHSVSDVDLEFQTYTGNSRFSGTNGVLEGIEGEARKSFGFITQAVFNDWTARAALHQAAITFDMSGSEQGAGYQLLVDMLQDAGYENAADNLRIEEDRVNYAEAALQYDNGRFIGIAESIYFPSHDSTPIGENRNFYITGGIRDGNVLYHLTHGRSDGDKPDIAGDIPSASPLSGLVDLVTTAFLPQDEAWVLGVRWDFAERMAFKAETVYLPEYQPRTYDVGDEFSLSIVRFGVQTIF